MLGRTRKAEGRARGALRRAWLRRSTTSVGAPPAPPRAGRKSSTLLAPLDCTRRRKNVGGRASAEQMSACAPHARPSRPASARACCHTPWRQVQVPATSHVRILIVRCRRSSTAQGDVPDERAGGACRAFHVMTCARPAYVCKACLRVHGLLVGRRTRWRGASRNPCSSVIGSVESASSCTVRAGQRATRAAPHSPSTNPEAPG